MNTASTNLPIALAAATIAALGAASATAQCQGDLLYTTRVLEHSNQCSTPTSISEVRTNSLQIVQPKAGMPFHSASYMPRAGYDALLGDGDGDADFHEPNIFGAIDATLLPRSPGGALLPIDKTRVFFSVKQSFTDTYGNTMSQGDIGRIRAGGHIELFISAASIRNAFGIPAGFGIDVDAVAMGFRPGVLGGDLYLSFEELEVINIPPFGVTAITDGSILRIPAGAMSYAASPYDGAMTVTGTAANSGQIIADEANMDVATTNAGVRDASGALVTSIIDVDGLTIDPTGGFWQSPWTPNPVHHLWYCGQSLTGAAVVSTVGGGSIPSLNGRPLASAVMTTGQQVGLVTSSGVSSLAGLSVTNCGTSHLSLDTATPVFTGAGTLELDVGGSTSAWALITVGLGCNTAGCVDTGTPLPNPDYPALVAPNVFFFQPTGADGCGRLSLFFPGPLVTALAGQTLVFQTVDFAGAGHLSNAVKISF